jgi:hypothetical protein
MRTDATITRPTPSPRSGGLSLGAARALAMLGTGSEGESIAHVATRAGLGSQRAALGLRELFHYGFAEPVGARWRLTPLGADHRRTLGWSGR